MSKRERYAVLYEDGGEWRVFGYSDRADGGQALVQARLIPWAHGAVVRPRGAECQLELFDARAAGGGA